MPELPEVETTVRGLRPVLEGARLTAVEARRADLRRAFPADLRQRLTGARVIALVKPQFETEARNLNRRGVVEAPEVFAAVRDRVLRACDKCGFSFADYVPSRVKGQDGNQEFFVHALRR